jgi:hypothetical protein
MKVAVCIEIKNENRYIKEWLDYHYKLGFDNVILYDNNDYNGEDVKEVINDYITNGFVIYESIKGKTNFQLPCYNACMNKYHKKFDWMLFLDCDEFLEFKDNINVHSYLSQEKFNNFEQILVNLENYGDCGLIYDDGDNVINRFASKIERTFKNTLLATKPFLKLTNFKRQFYVFNNYPNCISLYNTTCDATGNKIFPTRILFGDNDECIIRHYKTKTIKEYIERHKHDCHYDMNIQLVAKKLKGFFEINNDETNLEEKINIIKKEFPWYTHCYNKCNSIDIVLNGDNNPLLEHTIKSIRKNLSWVNKIFIVSTDEKNIDNTISIDIKTIVPDEFKDKDIDIALFLHNIKDLSENFIYVYNGTLFNYNCFEKEFFRYGKVCMSPINIINIPNNHRKTCYNNSKLFFRNEEITTFEMMRQNKGNFGYMFSSACCPMLKSDNKACYQYLYKEITNNYKNINHLIYPTWYKIMYHTFDYIHTNVSLSDFENKIIEIEDPIYKIINIPSTYVNDNMIKILDKKI